jgi:hypothetical protein
VVSRIEAGLEARKPLLYIHIQRESDRPRAVALQTSTRQAGFLVPGIENVSKKGLKSGHVYVNQWFAPGVLETPSHGYKQSGYGGVGIEKYQQSKNVFRPDPTVTVPRPAKPARAVRRGPCQFDNQTVGRILGAATAPAPGLPRRRTAPIPAQRGPGGFRGGHWRRARMLPIFCGCRSDA